MSKTTNQTRTIGNMIARKSGATVAELIGATFTSSVHRRLTDLKEKGWKVWREEIKGKNYGRYFGVPPKGTKTPTFAR